MKKNILFCSTFGLTFYFYLVTFLFSSLAVAQTASIPHALDEAISLFNAGNHNEAKTLLRQNLEYDPNDSDSRSVLGKMDYHLGEWQSAITIWSEGLNGKPSDYVFQMNIGNVFFEKAEQNAPSIYLTSYSEKDKEEKAELYQQDFIKNTSTSFLNYWQKGIDAYQAAYQIYPYEEYTLEKLADLYEMNREFDNSFIYYKQLAELYPENSLYLTNAAIYQAKIKTSNQKAQDSLQNLVIKRLNYSLEVDSQNPTTYKELARITAKKENFGKNKNPILIELTQKSDFYASIPKYARFEFSKEKAILLDKLFPKTYNDKKNWSDLVDSLVNSLFISDKHVENSKEARITENLLITVLAGDASDAKFLDIFDRYYTVLERNTVISTLAESQHGQWLLIQLLENTQEIKLNKEITTALVKKCVPNMYDILADLIEYDYMKESMEIAKNMAKLNDPRSKAKLISEINLPLPAIKVKNKTYISIQNRQLRAVLALSELEGNEMKRELLKGLENKNIRLFCAVALYSQTRDVEYLKLAKKYKSKKDFFPELGQFLKQFNNPKAQSLGNKFIKG